MKINKILKHGLLLFAYLFFAAFNLQAAKTIDQTLDVGAIDGAHSVNLSGAFTYTIPIKIPQGTMGMQPNLSLNYNSQGGNGIAGYGWNLSGVSAISRVNKSIYYDTEASAPDLSYDDGLALDGNRIFYEPEADITEGGKKVRAYYSKEATFQRIYTSNDETLNSFTVKTKDGKTIEYGNSTDSKLKAGSITLMWYMNKVTDRNGNYMTYHYKLKDKQIVLDRIEYTGNGTTKPHTKVNFSYETRSDKSNAYMAGTKIENTNLLKSIETRTNYTTAIPNGQHYKSYQLLFEENHFSYLKEFQEWGSEITATGKGRLNSLTFEYGGSEDSSVEVLDFKTNPKFEGLPETQTDTEKWVYLPGNFNGDGLQDFLGLKIKIDKKWPNPDEAYYLKVSIFLNKNKKNANGFEEIDISDMIVNTIGTTLITALNAGFENGLYIENSIIPVGGTNILNGDINGDNIDDIIFYTEEYNRYEYLESTGVGTYQDNPTTTGSINVRESNLARLVDIDSDGRLELFVLDAATSQSEKNHFYITSFGDRPYTYHFCDDFMPNSTINLSNWKLYTKDYEGTGRTHMIATIFGESKNRILSFDILSNGNCGAITSTQQNTEGIDTPPINSLHIHANRVDFNGDGKEDDLVVLPNSNKVQVNINNTLTETNIPYPVGGVKLFTADLNSDGFTDMIRLIKGTTDEVQFYINKGEGAQYDKITRNLGSQFFNDKSTGFDGKDNLIQLTDIDGDGIQELFLKRPDLAAPKVFRLNFNLENRLLKNVYDSYANQTKVHYNLLSREENYTFSTTNSYPYRTVSGAINVVSKVEFPTNVLNQFGTKDYTYENLTVHLSGKGMLGYTKVVEVDNLNQTKKESYFELDTDNAVMLPDKIISYVKNGNKYDVFTESTSTYTFELLTEPARDWLRLDQTTSIDHTNKTKTIAQYLNYDNNGNPKKSVTKIYDIQSTTQSLKYTTTEDITYKNCNWWITYLPETVKTTLNRQGYTGSNSRTIKYEYNIANGNLTKETTDPLTTNEIVSTYSSFDKFGNAKSIKINAKDETQRSSGLTFDNTGRFITQRKNSNNNIVENFTINMIWGSPTTVTDIDGNKTSFTYDNYGRVLTTTNYLSQKSSTSYSWKNSINAENTGYSIATVFKVSTTTPNAPNTVSYFDKFGREVLVSTQNYGTSKLVYSFKQFDNRGRTTKESGPFYISSNKEITATKFKYDNLSRVDKTETCIINNEGTTVTNTINYNYPVRMVEVSGTEIIDKTTTVDVTGKVITAEDLGGILHYSYNNFNELVEVKDKDGNVLSKNQYDNFGRQTTLTDINAGTTTYIYNPFDELTSQTDAKGNTTAITYDNLGRMKTKKLTDAKGVFIDYLYTYNTATENGALQLKSETGPNSYSTTYTYDTKGRLKDKTDKIGSVSLKTSQTYNTFGDIESITYPKEFTVNYTYDSTTGALKKATANNTDIYELTATNHLGQIIDYKYNKGTIPVNHTFDEFGMPVTTKATNGTLFNWAYDFNQANGNLISRKDVKNNEEENFLYDGLHRLTHVNENQLVKYSTNGNIEEKNDAGIYTYDQPNGKINAVTGITNTPNAISLLTEDISYTAFDRPKSIVEGNKTYELFYGSDDQRKKTEYTEDGIKTTRYYSGNYELITTGNCSVRKSVYHLSFANSVDVIYYKEEQPPSGCRAENAEELEDGFHYVFTDYLGSILKVVDANGNVQEEQSFDAWGRKRNPQDWTDLYEAADAKPKTLTWLTRGYTGHEHLYEFGIINMNNRLYDPIVGRMLAVDNFVGGSESTQAFNRYSYAMNNPLKYIDPNGEFAHIVVGAVIGGVINGFIHRNHPGGFWKGFAIGAVAGAVGAATGGAAFLAAGGGAAGAGGFLAGAAGGMVGAAFQMPIQSIGNNLVFGDPMMTGKEYIAGIALGGLIGGGINGGLALKNGKSFFNGQATKISMPAIRPVRTLESTQSELNSSGLRTKLNEVAHNGRTAEVTKQLKDAIPDYGPIKYESTYYNRVTGVDGQHSWNPTTVRIVSDNGRVFQITGGDTVERTLIQMPGKRYGENGIFELIIDKAVIRHQRFIPGGTVNGVPNQYVPNARQLNSSFGWKIWE